MITNRYHIFQTFLLTFFFLLTLTSSIQAAISLDISKPTPDQKIVLPNVPVKGKSDPSTLKIEWETTVEGKKSTTETKSNVEGNINVIPFPTRNNSFGENTVKATAYSPFGKLTGRITDATTGKPIYSTKIKASYGTYTFQVYTDSYGTYTFSSLPTKKGGVIYEVEASEYYSYHPETKTITIYPGETSILDFSLFSRYGKLTGRITNATTGKPIYSAKIEASYGTYTFQVYTDASGTYTLSLLTKKGGVIYEVKASQLGYYSQKKTITIYPGKTSVLNFSLVPLPKKSCVSLSPILPQVFKKDNQIFFEIKNTGEVYVSEGTLSIKFEGPDYILTKEVTFGTISPNGSITIGFDITIPEISPGTYTLYYILNYENNTIEGEVIIPPSNIEESIPNVSTLLSSFPNPADNGCWIPFMLANDSNISLEVYNIIGQKVRTIEVGQRKKGSYTQKHRAIFWDLRNDDGQPVSKGLYFYKINAGNFSAIKSMVVK